jgi:hypothetical protein
MLRERSDLAESYWWRFMFDTYVEAQGAAVWRWVAGDLANVQSFSGTASER